MKRQTQLAQAEVERVEELRELVALALREADLLDLMMTGIHLNDALESLHIILAPPDPRTPTEAD